MRTDLPADLAEIVARPPIYRLLGVAEKVHGKHLNHVWKGLAGIPLLDEPGVPVFVKYLPQPSQVDIEFACGMASQVLKLPVPKPALVVADLDDLPSRPATLKEGPVVLFGSVFQPPDPFFVRRTTDDPLAAEFIWSKVCENEVAPVGAAWDELVANPDRHVQNLLFDGGKWWLFDHNLALQPLSKLYSSIDQESAQAKIIDYVARVNQILDQLKQRRPHDHGVREEADKMLRQSKRLKILAIEMEKWQVDRRFSETIKMAALIVNLIALRLAPLALYVDRRLEVPTEDSLWSQS